jgi:hypothetical protein
MTVFSAAHAFSDVKGAESDKGIAICVIEREGRTASDFKLESLE